MTSAEPTPQKEALSGSVLGIIGAYRMGAALEAKDLYRKKATPDASPEAVVVTTDLAATTVA